MSDAKSIATKSTQRTNATTRSRRNNAQKSSKADWRIIVRDGYAALFDMIGDWTYLYAIYHRDYDGDGEADTYLLRIPFDYNLAVHTVLAFCILSTIFSVWTIATSLGRRCAKKNSLCCNCTVPRLAFSGIIMEDIPQFILTTWIDFTFTGGWTPAGVLNICSSMTALINRVTTRYDEIEEENEEGYDDVELGTVYEAMS